MDNASAYEWQKTCVGKIVTADAPRFLVSVWTGLGKTRAGARLSAEYAKLIPSLIIVVLVPTDDIAKSWRQQLHSVGLHCMQVGKDRNDRTVAGTTCACGAPANCLVMTYAFSAAHPHLLLKAVRGPHLLHLDEVHHLREGSKDRGGWVQPLVMASDLITRVVCYSATPCRTNRDERIPWVHTKNAATEELDPIPEQWTYERSYGQALTDRPPRAVTSVVFERFDGDAEWWENDDDGARQEFSKRISDKHTPAMEKKVRRYAVDGRGEWLRTALASSSAKRDEEAAVGYPAGGIAIGRHTDHAIAMADILVAQGNDPVFVYTNDYMTDRHKVGDGWLNAADRRPGHKPQLADDLVDKFRDGSAPWMVSVRKLAEGVDIARFRVLVYATVISTWLAFVQAVGRVLRTDWSLPEWADQCAWVYILNDRTMSGYAAQIEDEQAEAILEPEEDDERPPRSGNRIPASDGRRESGFVASTGEYAGATISGQHMDAELMGLAGRAGLGGAELPTLRKLQEAGLLRWSADEDADMAVTRVSDPTADLRRALAAKTEVVRSWAGARLRAGEFGDYTEAVRRCNKDLGRGFGVWKDSPDLTVEQVEKAIRWAKEQLQELRNQS